MDQQHLQEILDKHQLWLDHDEGGERANLREASLIGADLSGANLWGANLRGANLWGANLRGANLICANLICANLIGANLSGADLWGANLIGANLSEANLSDANLNGAAGNRHQIKSLFCSEKYPITYTSEYMQIGCERHLIADWWVFDSDHITRMDSGALAWWQEWKDTIRAIIEKSPAVPTKHEKTTEE